MTIEELYAIPINGEGWRILPDGNGVKLGNGVALGNWVTLGKSPLAIQGSRHLVVNVGINLIQVGYQIHDYDWWKEKGEQVGKINSYSSEEIEEYRKIFDFIYANGMK